MERTRKGITAGLAIRAAAISTSIPIRWDTSSHGVSLFIFSLPSKTHLRCRGYVCLLAYQMYAALHKPHRSL